MNHQLDNTSTNNESAVPVTVTASPSEYLYFVGKGDGTHQFSRTLEEHNRAVARYQLGK